MRIAASVLRKKCETGFKFCLLNVNSSNSKGVPSHAKGVLQRSPSDLWKGQAYFDMWVEKAEQSALKAIRKLAKTFQKHATGIINYIKHKVTNALVERINGKIQNLNQVAKGYTSFHNFRIAVLFFNGKLSLFSHN